MQIQFLGLSSFKITNKDTVIVTDPFTKSTGLTPSRFQVDIACYTEIQNPDYSNPQENAFIIQNAGDYDYKNTIITGIPIKHEKGYHIVYFIEAEEIKILYLGHIENFNMKSSDIEDLGDIDVLILPVGGQKLFLEAEDAVKVINQINPKIAIPSCYQESSGTIKTDPISLFTKNMGLKNVELTPKLILKKRDLTQEQTQIIILEN